MCAAGISAQCVDDTVMLRAVSLVRTTALPAQCQSATAAMADSGCCVQQVLDLSMKVVRYAVIVEWVLLALSAAGAHRLPTCVQRIWKSDSNRIHSCLGRGRQVGVHVTIMCRTS